MTHQEVSTLLGDFFPRGQMTLDDSRVEFRRADESIAVYEKEEITQIIADHSLTDGERTAVRHLMQPAAQRMEYLVDATVLFAPEPVSGYWRFGGDWQILPMPEGAPAAFHKHAPHPFRLEFRYWRSGHPEVDIVRRRSRDGAARPSGPAGTCRLTWEAR